MLGSQYMNKGKRTSRILSILLAVLLAFVPMAVYFPTNVQAATTLNVYPAPSGVTLNTDYTVQVREPGGTWQDLDEYQTTIGSSPSNASFVYFDTDGQVEMSVTYNVGSITSAVIRGLNLGITPTINGNTMTFSISGPMKLSVEVNGNVNRNLMIFANPLEVNPPSPTDPDVIYLGPGVYTQDYTVTSGKTLYIAGGAVVKGGVILDNATNAKVIGRGVLDHPQGKAISADYTNQITIDGIIVNDYGNGNEGGCAIALGNATNVLINNFKAFSVKKWGDAIDSFSSSNITINDVFIRSHDDAIAIYNARANGGRIWYGDSANITVTNSILMPDVARPINMGTHGFPWAPGGGHTIENLTFSNLDLWLHNNAAPIQFISADGNLIQNVNFNDIRIDDHSPNKILNMAVKSWDYGHGRGINDIYFKNVTYTGTNANVNSIEGYSSTRKAQNITFENLVVNGDVKLSAAAANFTTNSYASNLNFIASGASAPEVTPLFPSPAPINLALNKAASASSAQGSNPVASGNDGSVSTRWSAVNGDTGHWWTVDLGSSKDITGGTRVMWEQSGVAYKYKIETSNDNANWTLQVDKTNNTSTDQIQNDLFLDTARYVKITVTGLPSGAWASFYDFKVLGDTVNLAENKVASSDSTLTGFSASSGVDGNPTSRWSAADQAANHWVTVDLGLIRNITYGTQVSFEKSGVAYQYKIETSKDQTNWTLKVDKTSNTSTEGVQTDYFTDNARYVRITVTGLPSGASASFYDLKVFGDPTNLALGKTVSSDSSQSANPASYGNDGIMTTRWSANDGNAGHWYKVDLGKNINITGTQVMWEQFGAAYKYKIETSTDNINWNTKVDKFADVTDINKQGNTRANQASNDYFSGAVRYVKITVTGMPSGAWASFYDFKIFGTFNGPTFHSDTNYGGKAVTLDLGNYTLAQMQEAGITNDSISSIRVPADYTVVAYSNDGFSGTSWTLTSDNSSLVASGNNDMISSIKVISAGPTFYSDSNYGGTAVTLRAGDYTLAQMQAAGITNNSISSLRVPDSFLFNEYKVVAYSDDGFSGTSWTFTSDIPSLVASGSNDAISSVKITTHAIEAPTAPTNLAATAFSSTQINLSWTAATDNVGVTGYKIYRDGVEVGTSTTTSYSATGLTASTAYSFTVKAYDHAANLSAASNTANATTLVGVVSGSTYKLVARHSGKVAGIQNNSTANGGLMEQQTDSGNNAQKWIITDLGNGYYKIINLNSSKSVDIGGASTAEGVQATQWTYNGGNNQQWTMLDLGNGYWKIIARHSSKLLEVSGSSTLDGASIQQKTDAGGTNQEWQLVIQ
jgi:hypothetical protein